MFRCLAFGCREKADLETVSEHDQFFHALGDAMKMIALSAALAALTASGIAAAAPTYYATRAAFELG